LEVEKKGDAYWKKIEAAAKKIEQERAKRKAAVTKALEEEKARREREEAEIMAREEGECK
jgi:translation initiation factor 3 subunit A